MGLLAAIALMAVMTLVEFLRPAVPGKGDRLLNLQAMMLLVATQALAVPAILRFTHLPTAIDSAALPFWLGAILFFVAMDLGEYLFHRAQHAIPWLWKLHSLHHSDPNMSATTANRHFWGDPILKALTIWPVAAALIRPTPAILAAYVWLSLWHTIVHSNVRLDFGRFSWLLNSPAYHRRHHSSEPAHFNSNYSALFPIFDVIAGSYHRPDSYPDTGLDARPANIVHAAVWPIKA